MNKILVYSLVAILFGTIIMIGPLAFVHQNQLIPENILNGSGDNEETFEQNGTTLLPEAPTVPLTPDYSDRAPEDSNEKIITTTQIDVVSNLSAIGLIIIPGFLFALVAFSYLKKRTQ